MSNPYDPNPYAGGSGAMAQPHPKGTTVLVLGILSIVIGGCGLGIILGAIAMTQGKRALAEIDANPAAYNNRQNVNVGRILGIVGLVLGIVGLIFTIIYVVVVVIAAGQQAS